MGGTLIVGRGTTIDDALADYEEHVKEAQEQGLHTESDPEVFPEGGEYVAVGHAHS